MFTYGGAVNTKDDLDAHLCSSLGSPQLNPRRNGLFWSRASENRTWGKRDAIGF